MDRVSEAEAILATALAHRPSVVVPGHAPSPMDCESTIPVDRTLVRACDRQAHGDEHRPASDDVDRLDQPPRGDLLDAEMLRASRGLEPDRGTQRTA